MSLRNAVHSARRAAGNQKPLHSKRLGLKPNDTVWDLGHCRQFLRTDLVTGTACLSYIGAWVCDGVFVYLEASSIIVMEKVLTYMISTSI